MRLHPAVLCGALHVLLGACTEPSTGVARPVDDRGVADARGEPDDTTMGDGSTPADIVDGSPGVDALQPPRSDDVAAPLDRALNDAFDTPDAPLPVDAWVGDVTAPDRSTPPFDAVITDAATPSDTATPLDGPLPIDASTPSDAATPLDRPLPVDAIAVPDGGPSGAWELIGDFDNGLWQFGHFLTVAPDGTLYLARSREGVYRGVRRGGGYAFDLMTTAGLTNLAFSALGVNARGEPLLGCFAVGYGGTGPGSIFRFDPASNRWTSASVPAPGYTRNVSDFYTAPDGSVFATGGWSALLLRSTDGGDTFALRNNLDTARPGVRYGLLFSIEVGPGGEMFVGAESEGFQRSFDEGRSFTPVGSDPWLQRGNPYGVGFTRSGDALFSRAIDVDPTKIYRRDPSRGWVRADTGLAGDPINTAPINNWISTIALSPWGDNFIATATTVYRARDGGPWAPFVAGLDPAFQPWPNTIVADARCVYVALRPVSPRSDAGRMYRYCGP